MTSIYKKTFIKESTQAINKLDDHLSFVEQSIDDLHISFRKLTKGNAENLYENSKTNVSYYEDKLERLSILFSDMYHYKNEILEDLASLKEN